MADLNKMDRTWLCSVLFMDIVNYSSQSVELQMKWKQRFNSYLSEAIQDVPESERVILDTGDGAAICFLGAPEAAMFAALSLCRAFVLDEREQKPGLRVRLGINLGPVKLVKDINGALNAIGDGINAGQRIMSFASANQILVSQSFFEVVSRVSDDYKPLFQLKGVETDKHIREHTVYHLVPPGSEKGETAVVNADGKAIPSTPVLANGGAASPIGRAPQGRSSIPWMLGGAAVVVLAAVGAWRFYGSAAPAKPSVDGAPVAKNQSSTPNPTPSATVSEPTPPPVAASRPGKSASAAHPEESTAVKSGGAPVASPPTEHAPTVKLPLQPGSSTSGVSPAAKAAYEDGSRLLDDDQPGEAARRFDDAIRASPNYVDAYVGRAESRRRLQQYDLSLEDCNNVIRVKPSDFRGYNCRGFSHQLLQQYNQALPDLNEAIRLNPNFALAYDHRGTVYVELQQNDRAVQDYSQAIRLQPKNVMSYMKRAAVYDSLKQYRNAIQDYNAVIKLEPNNLKAYTRRAFAESASGDASAAQADRRHLREARGKK